MHDSKSLFILFQSLFQSPLITYHAQYIKSSNMIQSFIFKIFITILMYDNEVFMIPNIKSIFFKYLSLHFNHDSKHLSFKAFMIHIIKKSICIIPNHKYFKSSWY